MDYKSIIAITGPSGVGKNTLGEKLAMHPEISIPVHCTTRDKRDDDKNGFYRYLSHDEYNQLLNDGKFLLSSGDGPVVKKEYGNFYGVLIQDCIEAWKKSDIIILFVSYKDIDTLISLSEKGMNIDIVNLTFTNLESGIKARLIGNVKRNHTVRDITSRVACAIEDDRKYGEALRMHAKSIVFTDLLDIKQTYIKVCEDLKISRRING